MEATGLKYDTEKIPLELLDPLALEGLGKVLEFGKKKYAAHNWRGGITYSRLLGASSSSYLCYYSEVKILTRNQAFLMSITWLLLDVS
jgi:hypothetical protein